MAWNLLRGTFPSAVFSSININAAEHLLNKIQMFFKVYFEKRIQSAEMPKIKGFRNYCRSEFLYQIYVLTTPDITGIYLIPEKRNRLTLSSTALMC